MSQWFDVFNLFSSDQWPTKTEVCRVHLHIFTKDLWQSEYFVSLTQKINMDLFHLYWVDLTNATCHWLEKPHMFLTETNSTDHMFSTEKLFNYIPKSLLISSDFWVHFQSYYCINNVLLPHNSLACEITRSVYQVIVIFFVMTTVVVWERAVCVCCHVKVLQVKLKPSYQFTERGQ